MLLDAPPVHVAAPVAQSANTTIPVPAIAVDNHFVVLDPYENDVTPAASMPDGDDFGSKDVIRTKEAKTHQRNSR